MAENPKRIVLIDGGGRREEAIASVICRPGHILMLDSNGKVKPHNSVGGFAESMFAVEDALQGKIISDAYAVGDLVMCYIAHKGDVIYAYANGGDLITKGDFLTSAGDGSYQVATGTQQRHAVALETVDARDSNDVNERLKVRIL